MLVIIIIPSTLARESLKQYGCIIWSWSPYGWSHFIIFGSVCPTPNLNFTFRLWYPPIALFPHLSSSLNNRSFFLQSTQTGFSIETISRQLFLPHCEDQCQFLILILLDPSSAVNTIGHIFLFETPFVPSSSRAPGFPPTSLAFPPLSLLLTSILHMPAPGKPLKGNSDYVTPLLEAFKSLPTALTMQSKLLT